MRRVRLIIFLAILFGATLVQSSNGEPFDKTDGMERFRESIDPTVTDSHVALKILKERIAVYKRILQNIKTQDIDHIVTTPVVKWAQSDSQIYVMIKLSNRQDSPTCSDIRDITISFTDVEFIESDLTFSNLHSENLTSKASFDIECYYSSQKFIFGVIFDFEKLLSKVTLRKVGLGLFTLVGDKLVTEIWAKPFLGSNKAVIWSEMRKKHEDAMTKYFEMIAMEEQKVKSKGKGKKRRNGKKAEENAKTEEEPKKNEETSL